jgi:hypothetical protein
MLRKTDSIKWLDRRKEEYHLLENDIGGVVEDFDKVGKLGRGFAPVDELIEVDIGKRGSRHPTYVSANLIVAQREKIYKLLVKFVDRFA